jgi:quinol monooxygenase YgiN
MLESEGRRAAMIIVSGKIYVRPGARQAFLLTSTEAVAQARRFPGCRDFVVAADPLEPDRVNVYEEWESEEALLAFRGDGPEADLGASILRADVFRHVVASTGPA